MESCLIESSTKTNKWREKIIFEVLFLYLIIHEKKESIFNVCSLWSCFVKWKFINSLFR